MSTKKILSMLLCLVMVLGLCVTASADAAEKEVIQLWDFRVEAEAAGMKALVDRYNELHDDVMIEYTSVNQDRKSVV